MAKQVQKGRKAMIGGGVALPGDPVSKRQKALAKNLDDKLEKKGFFAESDIVEKGETAKRAQRAQQDVLGRQRQLIAQQSAESEDEIARRRLLARRGGRRSLIASR